MSGVFWSAILSFLLVTIIGSIFAYNLQFKNWLRQQQLSSHETRIADLTRIFFDLDATFSKRLYWTRRLLYRLRRYDEAQLTSDLANYSEAITEWNEKRSSFQIQLAGVVGVSAWSEFEHFLAKEYIGISSELEKFARLLRASKGASVDRHRLNEIETELNSLSHYTMTSPEEFTEP